MQLTYRWFKENEISIPNMVNKNGSNEYLRSIWSVSIMETGIKLFQTSDGFR